jgi:hypothetical protein
MFPALDKRDNVIYVIVKRVNVLSTDAANAIVHFKNYEGVHVLYKSFPLKCSIARSLSAIVLREVDSKLFGAKTLSNTFSIQMSKAALLLTL